MRRVLNAGRVIVEQLGTLILFYLLLYSLGLKAAIAGALVFVVADGARRHIWKLGFPKLYILTSALTFLFGGIDLLSHTPFMIKYEAVITSLVIAATFALGAGGGKSMIQEIAEQQSKQSFPDRADVRAFFKLLTLAWAGYFVIRAIVYFWIGEIWPIERVMSVRPILGGASLLVMMAISFQGRRLFLLCRWLGLFPVE
ncbi:MAG: septation protein IspZ [Aliidongia sp.]